MVLPGSGKVIADCATGEAAISGGFDLASGGASPSGLIKIWSSFGTGGDAASPPHWEVGYNNDTGVPQKLSVHAVCFDVTPVTP
jgi:hypothetical protein